MTVQAWTFVMVGFTFALYIGVAIRSRAGSTGGVLRCGWQCASGSKRHGDSRRLDERRIVHLHGGAYLVHGTRRFSLSDGLDWWVRVTSVAAGAHTCESLGNIPCRTLWAIGITQEPLGWLPSSARFLYRSPTSRGKCAA